jgi:hypothetical protein
MKNIVLLVFSLIVILGCNERISHHEKQIDLPLPNNGIVSNSKDSIKKDLLFNIKKIVRSELKDKVLDSVIVSNKDSIKPFQYITNIFSENELDSIEYFGQIGHNFKAHYHLPLNSLLILYFNNKKIAKQELDSLNLNWKTNFRETEAMVKAGGILFELDNQLCIYSINTCGPGYKKLLSIDSIISNKVFTNKPFHRLHSGCGMGPFKSVMK